MNTWVLTPKNKKSAIETEYWQKNDVIIEVTTVWRWASVLIDADETPDIDLTNDDDDEGLYVYSLEYEVTPYDYTDGDTLINFPDDLSEDEVERIEKIYDAEFLEGLENDGWEQLEVEMVFYGELELSELP